MNTKELMRKYRGKWVRIGGFVGKVRAIQIHEGCISVMFYEPNKTKTVMGASMPKLLTKEERLLEEL